MSEPLIFPRPTPEEVERARNLAISLAAKKGLMVIVRRSPSISKEGE